MAYPAVSMMMKFNYDDDDDYDDISHISAGDGVSCGQYKGDDENKTPYTAVNPDLWIIKITMIIIMTVMIMIIMTINRSVSLSSFYLGGKNFSFFQNSKVVVSD